VHICVNERRGCRAELHCSRDYIEEDGVRRCEANPVDELECADCFTSHCDECGHILNIERHDDDCSEATAV
jgi:hypothetical protein